MSISGARKILTVEIKASPLGRMSISSEPFSAKEWEDQEDACMKA